MISQHHIANASQTDTTDFNTLDCTMRAHILGFLELEETAEKASVSKTFKAASIVVIESYYRIRLKNLYVFKFRAEENPLESAKKELDEALETHGSYKAAWTALRAQYTKDLQDAGYRNDLINLISPEVLGTAPMIEFSIRNSPMVRVQPDSSLPLTGISRTVLPYGFNAPGRPCIIFRYHMTRQDNSQGEEVRVLCQQVDDDDVWSFMIGHVNDQGTVEAIERNGNISWRKLYRTVPKDTEMLADSEGPFRQILTQYRRSILDNIEPTPVVVQPVQSPYPPAAPAAPVSVKLVKPKK